MTSGRVIARNTIFNLIGHGAPMLVAIVAIPFLIAGLGTERFGVLTLVWMIIGYFSLFDLGLGRALTQLVAERLGNGREDEVVPLVWTGLALMAVLGLAGAAVLALITPWLVTGILNIPPPLQLETLRSSYLLACSIPFVISTAGLRGVLEAKQRFGLINAVRLPMGIFTFLGPLLVLPFTSNLFPIVVVAVGGRLVAWLIHLVLCFRVVPELRRGSRPSRALAFPLLRFGGWMTVSNLVSPLMVYLDRFLIGALLSMTAVAYYVTPYEVVTKLWLIPGALVGVLFPAFASSFLRDQRHTALLFDRGLKTAFISLFPLTLVLVAYADVGLAAWLGAEFAQNSTRVLQWLAIGVFINSLAQISFSILQGVGRPDLTGKLHLLELPLYLVALWWLVGAYGIEGAAIAWVGRIVIDSAVLLLLTTRYVPATTPAVRRESARMVVAIGALGVAALPLSLLTKTAFVGLTLIAFALLVWYRILDGNERLLLRTRLRARPPPSDAPVVP
jgi:O-antigen/teichoic acid export membrane protein